MKTVVSVQDLLEREIKPNDLLSEYLRLSAAEVESRWGGGRDCTEVACPACGSEASDQAFLKNALWYRVCRRCESLFVSPRPDDRSLAAYYQRSEPALFWRDRILPTTSQARQEKLSVPRALWVVDTIAEHLPEAEVMLDFSTHGSAVVEAVMAERPGLRVVAGHWTAAHDYPQTAAVEVAPDWMFEERTLSGVDVLLAFDALDRVSDLEGFVASAYEALKPGGLLFITAPSSSGFDLQVLWEDSPAITPPDKLNLLSAAGWLARFPKPDWEIVEFSTPGMFDVENVRRAVAAAPSHPWPRVIRSLVESEELARIEFQTYLQRFRLASFARLVVRRTP